MTVEEALQVMAEVARAAAVQTGLGHLEHEDFPEIGELDFLRIVEMAGRDAPSPPPVALSDEAYELLAERADDEGGIF